MKNNEYQSHSDEDALAIDGSVLCNFAAALAESIGPVVYPTGSVIFELNEQSGCAYLIESGEVEIYSGSSANASRIAVLGPGELFGEMAAIDNRPRSASARVLKEAELIPINSEQINKSIAASDPLLQLLIRVLLERARGTQRNCEKPVLPKETRLGSEARTGTYQAIHGRALTKLKMEQDLQDALRRREFELYFQPIVRLEDESTAGFEALIRWQSQQHGTISPDAFIDIAEESGLIVPIGQWVLEHACHAAVRFQNEHRRRHPDRPPLFMSANVSARQLRTQSDVARLISAINSTIADPSCMKIEITERLLMQDPQAAARGMKQLKDLGVSFAIDDFGTGYSSLSYLHQFPLDTLKLDRSFVQRLVDDHDAREVVKAVISLAKALSMDVVAEGVERQEERKLLQSLGCELAQGFLFARPMPQDRCMTHLNGSM